eukprot:scaffold823_cov219-Amphora_coffeaeformis.AAC.39
MLVSSRNVFTTDDHFDHVFMSWASPLSFSAVVVMVFNPIYSSRHGNYVDVVSFTSRSPSARI